MKDKIDARWFLRPSDPREELRKPFIFKNYTAYLNGFSALLLPTDKKHQEPKAAEVIKFMNKMLPRLEAAKKDSFLLPSLEIPEPEACWACKESGLLLEESCHECGGKGAVEWSTSYNSYSDDCKTCGGEGEILIPGKGDTCPYCQGIKKRFYTQYPVYIKKLKLDAAFLYPLAKIEGLRVFPFIGDPGPVLFFYGDDFSGLILGMKPSIEMED